MINQIEKFQKNSFIWFICSAFSPFCFMHIFLFYVASIRSKISSVNYRFRSQRINAIAREILADQDECIRLRVFLWNRRITAFEIGTGYIFSLCLYSHDGRRLWSVGNNGDKNSSDLFCESMNDENGREDCKDAEREREYENKKERERERKRNKKR